MSCSVIHAQTLELHSQPPSPRGRQPHTRDLWRFPGRGSWSCHFHFYRIHPLPSGCYLLQCHPYSILAAAQPATSPKGEAKAYTGFVAFPRSVVPGPVTSIFTGYTPFRLAVMSCSVIHTQTLQLHSQPPPPRGRQKHTRDLWRFPGAWFPVLSRAFLPDTPPSVWLLSPAVSSILKPCSSIASHLPQGGGNHIHGICDISQERGSWPCHVHSYRIHPLPSGCYLLQCHPFSNLRAA